MLEVQREAIVAEAAAASQSLIGRELESLSNYLNAIGTQAAVMLGGTIWLYGASDLVDTVNTVPRGFYYILCCLSLCSLSIVCVTSTLIAARAATYALTSSNQSAMRHTVLRLRWDCFFLQVAYAVGIVAFLFALIISYITNTDAPAFEAATNIVIVSLTIVIMGAVSCRAYKRYPGIEKAESPVVSGEAFLRINTDVPPAAQLRPVAAAGTTALSTTAAADEQAPSSRRPPL